MSRAVLGSSPGFGPNVLSLLRGPLTQTSICSISQLILRCRNNFYFFENLYSKVSLVFSNMATESSYPVLTANLDLRGELFQTNKKSWGPVLERFGDALKQVSSEGNDTSLKRHLGRGQLLRTYICASGRLY
jgi:hypothetical protein